MGSRVGYLKYRGEGTHEGGRGGPCKEGEEAPMAGVVGIICPAPAVVWCGQLEEKPWAGNPTSQVTILFQPTNTTTASQFINKI